MGPIRGKVGPADRFEWGIIVTEKLSTVLLAGNGRGPFEAIAPILDRRHLKIEHVLVPEEAVALAVAKPFDLVTFEQVPHFAFTLCCVERVTD